MSKSNPATKYASALNAQLDAVAALPAVSSDRALKRSVKELKTHVKAYGDKCKKLAEKQ